MRISVSNVTLSVPCYRCMPMSSPFYLFSHGGSHIYVHMFMDRLERRLLLNAEVKPHIWWRYIDVIFIVWTEGEERLREFTDYLNNVHETIKFTCKWSEHEIEFLDIEVLNESGVLEMEVLISQQKVINICITVLVTWMHVNYIEFVRSPVFLKREWESW